MEIKPILGDGEKQKCARQILESLQDWFGIPEAREEYIEGSAGKPFFCAFDRGAPIGFLYLKETGNVTMELEVMGVLQQYHRKGVGRALFRCARAYCCREGYSFIQVKLYRWEDTIAMTKPTGSISRWDFRNSRCFLHCGIRGIPARSM